MCSVRAGTSADHITEDKLVNRAFQMQSLNFADLDTTTLGKPQKPGVKPNIPQEKAMTEETRAYIILAAVAACMGFLLIWWKAMQKVTQNGNLSLPLMDKTIRCDPLQPAVDQPAPKTSASVYAKQRQHKEYKQPLHPRVAAAIGKTSASVITEHEQPTTEQHLGAIEGYSAEEITKIREWNKVISQQQSATLATSPHLVTSPLMTRQWESKGLAKSNSNSGFSKFANAPSSTTAVASPASTTIRSPQANRQLSPQASYRQKSTTQYVQQTRVRGVDAPRMPVVMKLAR